MPPSYLVDFVRGSMPKFEEGMVPLCSTGEYDPDLWTSDVESAGSRQAAAAATEKAILLCRGCPVATSCLQFALANPSLTGVWGGTTPRRRSFLRSLRP